VAPLTLFTGANSAGKSTIIQSILLTAQTIQSSVFSRPVVLNGHMARLGSFQDLVSSGDETRDISIGFDLSVDKKDVTGGGQRLWRQSFYIRRGDALDQVSADFSFSVRPGPNEPGDEDLLRLQPSLIESRVAVEYSVDGKKLVDQIGVKRSIDKIEKRIADLKLPVDSTDGVLFESLKYSVPQPSRTSGYGGRMQGLQVDSTVVGAYLHHFLPVAVAARFDEVSAQVAWQASMLTQPNFRHYVEPRIGEGRVPQPAVDFVCELVRPLLKESGGSGLRSTQFSKRRLSDALDEFSKTGDPAKFANIYRQLTSKDVSQVSSLLAADKQNLQRLLRDNRQPSYDLEIQQPGEQIGAGIDYIRYFFSHAVKYLGPLRDEPKPVYPLAGAADPSDVGFRGEHTAAVLDIHKSKSIEYIPTAQFSGASGAQSPISARLADAVQDWLVYMGVGSNFHTLDLGKLGHELKISTQGSQLEHDLTQVGVGVSQVLPILVLALLAEAGSTLIFEQPELHLHPKVQSRLADFFVSMTLLGKQCVVETHSEYLINRLRFRAASDSGSSVADSVIIYFVEKEASKSAYRRVTIDELGGLDSWPAGFFDESEHATAALLRQSLKKRRDK
jgi:predicted ATPase